MPDVLKIVKWGLNPTGMLISEVAKIASKNVDEAAARGIDELRAEVAKQEVRLDFEQKQAKIAQELAIAQRISEAETVEIEEFYDLSGKAKVGVNADAKSETILVGLSGSATRVSKRIYTFKGKIESSYVQELKAED